MKAMQVSDFMYKAGSLAKPLFTFEEVSSLFGKQLVALKFLIFDSYARDFVDPDCNKRYLKFLPGFETLKETDRAAYYYDGGRVYLLKNELRLWRIDWSAFFAYLRSSWQLGGVLKEIDAGHLWLLGVKNGVCVFFGRSKTTLSDTQLKQYKYAIMVVPCVFDSDFGEKIFLDQYLTVREGVLHCGSIDAVINRLSDVEDVELDADVILLDKEMDLRFSREQKRLWFIKPDDDFSKTEIKMNKRDAILLKFLYSQACSVGSKRYFDIADIKAKDLFGAVDIEDAFDKAKSFLYTLHEKYNGLPQLIEKDKNGAIRLNPNLSSVKEFKKKKVFPK